MSARCKSCGAEITWAFTHAGKRMPVDAKPTEGEPGGNVTLMTMDDGRLIATVHGKPEDIKPSFERYTAHFVTCPNAARHRKTP